MSHMLRCPQVLFLSLPSSLSGKKTAHSWAAQVPSPTPHLPSDSILILEPVAPCHLPQKSYKPPCFPFTHTLNLSYKDPRTIRQGWQIFLDSKVRGGRRCLIMAETKLLVLVGPSATIYRSGSERIKYLFQSKLIKGFKPRSFANKW